MVQKPVQSDNALADLQWLVAMGADEAVADEPIDRFSIAPVVAQKPQPAPQSQPVLQVARRAPVTSPVHSQARAVEISDNSVADARKMAAECGSLNDIVAALEKFDACALKRTATNLCVYDGNDKAKVMLIGEAPGRDEDIQGKPFVGRSGQLLDKILTLAGLPRDGESPDNSVFISNMVFWRPPGNRKPTEAEIMMCMPFLARIIDVVRPQFIVCLGGVPSQRMTGETKGITKIRGRWFDYQYENGKAQLLATLHPSYLLRNPEQKRLAWRDFLALKQKLNGQDG